MPFSRRIEASGRKPNNKEMYALVIGSYSVHKSWLAARVQPCYARLTRPASQKRGAEPYLDRLGAAGAHDGQGRFVLYAHCPARRRAA